MVHRGNRIEPGIGKSAFWQSQCVSVRSRLRLPTVNFVDATLVFHSVVASRIECFEMFNSTSQVRRGLLREPLQKCVGEANVPSGAKTRVHFAAFTARLKSCPFKAAT